MNNNLLIVSVGSYGYVVKEIAEAMHKFDKVDIFDSIEIDKYQEYINDYKYAIVALGNNFQRVRWIEKLKKQGFTIPVIIHPTVYLSPSATVMEGTIIEAKASINSNVVIETGCIIGIGAIVDHDAVIKNGSHIDSGAIVMYYRLVDSLTKVDCGRVFEKELSYF